MKFHSMVVCGTALALSVAVSAQTVKTSKTAKAAEAAKTEQPAKLESGGVTVTPTYTSNKEALSYAIGVTTARNLLKDGVEIDFDVVLKGMKDAVSGNRTVLSEAEIRTLMNTLVTDMRQKYVANRQKVEESNRKRGEDFRASYAKEPGVQKLPSGVLYKVEATGKGVLPKDEDTVVVNYRGTLVDGKEFDLSPAGKPVSFKLAQLIPGWKDALRQMPAGSRWKIVVPSDLAYGQRGIGTDVGPNETLVFDVELVEVKPAQ